VPCAQICKHLTLNRDAVSCYRCWELLVMCLRSFAASEELEPYLLNLIVRFREGQGDQGAEGAPVATPAVDADARSHAADAFLAWTGMVLRDGRDAEAAEQVGIEAVKAGGFLTAKAPTQHEEAAGAAAAGPAKPKLGGGLAAFERKVTNPPAVNWKNV
jgi:hypothetical protein